MPLLFSVIMLSFILLSVIMLSVIVLSAIMLSVIMLSVVSLSVVAPFALKAHKYLLSFFVIKPATVTVPLLSLATLVDAR